MKKTLFFLFSLFMVKANAQISLSTDTFNQLARDYVKLGLVIGQYDSDFVDAYYGPDSLKPVLAKAKVFPKDSLIKAVKQLQKKLASYLQKGSDEVLMGRAFWIKAQLTAFDQRIRIFSGEYSSFDKETKALFGVVVPRYKKEDYQRWLNELNRILPGSGTANYKFEALVDKFSIPGFKVDTLFKTAIQLSRNQTLKHLKLPADESFDLEYVKGKPWSGYNWYKGNFHSLIQLNTDVKILIERAIDVASHESYPGHHVYNTLLEQRLYKEKGWVEISLYPLFSPQSLIAEGTANYGIELVFPGDEKLRFAKEVLLPLAGMDTTGITTYFKALVLKSKLNFVRNDVARGLLDGTMKTEVAQNWLIRYGLYNNESAKKSIDFIRKYRSYVINYNYGLQLVRNYVERTMGNDKSIEHRWQVFATLLSNQFTSSDLLP
jgi:hypothetical protein